MDALLTGIGDWGLEVRGQRIIDSYEIQFTPLRINNPQPPTPKEFGCIPFCRFTEFCGHTSMNSYPSFLPRLGFI